VNAGFTSAQLEQINVLMGKQIDDVILDKIADLLLPVREVLDALQAALNGPVGPSSGAMGPNILSFINSTALRSVGVYADPVCNMLQQLAIRIEAYGRFMGHVAAHPTEANLAAGTAAAGQLQRTGKVLAACTELARTCNEPGVKDHQHLVATVAWEDLEPQILSPELKVASGHKQLGAMDATKRKALFDGARALIPAPAAPTAAATALPMGGYMPMEHAPWQAYGPMGYQPSYMPTMPPQPYQGGGGQRPNQWSRDQHAGGSSKKAKTG
jgi:hypothetical protein